MRGLFAGLFAQNRSAYTRICMFKVFDLCVVVRVLVHVGCSVWIFFNPSQHVWILRSPHGIVYTTAPLRRVVL